MLRTLRKTGHISEVEVRIRTKDRVLRTACVQADVIQDGDEPLMLTIHYDTTAQRTAERALRESEARVRALNEELEQRVADRTARIRELTMELTRRERRERRRLAQVVHGDLQQILAAAAMRVEVAENETSLPRMRDAIAAVGKILAKSIESTRALARHLCPVGLHEQGLATTFRAIGQEMAERHGLNVDVKATLDPRMDPEKGGDLVCEAVRELLFNVVKHAKVPRAGVRLKRRGRDGLQIEVKDDGRGFDTSPVLGRHSRRGFGLDSIRESLGALGGQMEIASAPGRGTLVTLYVPFKTSRPRRILKCCSPQDCGA